MKNSFILNHLGEEREQYFNAVCPPIIQSSNFQFKDIASFRNALADESNHYIYTRGNNPTVAILRKKIAALEGAEDALVFASGSAAIATSIISNVQAGDHIVCVSSPYSWTNNLIVNFLERFAVSCSFVDATDIANIESVIQKNTKVLYLESPNSITFELQDLAACAALAKKHQLVSIIDNSYASPIFQNPIQHGIDIVVHSATKYINGHSDVVVGLLCTTKERIKKIFSTDYMILGGVISPHDASLVLRGLRTLEIRMKKSDESCKKIVKYLQHHPKVEQVIYPFAKDFPQYELAKKQMTGCGGLFSILLKTDRMIEVENFIHRLERFLFAVSWGGYESLALPFCAFYNIPGKANTSKPWNLIRFYIGLEDPDWLIEDLEQALLRLK